MKSRYIFAPLGLLAIAMTGCTADEAINMNGDKDSIEFNVNAINQTRAASSYCSTNLPTSFRVYANYTENSVTSLYFADDVVNKTSESSGSNSVYKPKDARYWPDGNGTMDFYAYVSTYATVAYSKTGAQKFNSYTVKDNVSEQEDLMYAVKTSVSATLTNGEHAPVNLNFRHALSQICFRGINQNPKIKITINSITVHNVYNKGNQYEFPTTSTENTYTNHTDNEVAEQSTLNHGSWTLDLTNTKDYTVSPSVTLHTPKNKNDITTSDITCPGGTAEKPHTDFSKVMILMPQYKGAAVTENSNAVPTDDGVYFTVNMKIQNVAYDAVGNEVLTDVTPTGGSNYYAPVEIDWKEGIRYIYTFKFSDKWDYNNTRHLEFDVETDDFVTKSNQELSDYITKQSTEDNLEN